MDDLPSAPEGNNSEVEEEKVPSASTASEQREEGVLTEHDGDKAREIEAAFADTQEQTKRLKQEAHNEGKELAQRSQEVPQSPPQPVQEVPKPDQKITQPPTPGDRQPEHLQIQPEQQREQQQMHPLTNSALVSSEQRAILREKMRAENGEVQKAA